jgi:flagellar motor switch protein FliN/FliY
MAEKAAARKKAAPAKPAGLEALKDVDVEVSVELGRTKITLDQALDMGDNSLQELNRRVGEPVDIRLNGKLFARGEVVTVSENFGVRITEIIGQSGE